MSNSVEHLLARDDLEPADPANEADVQSVARQYNEPLPTSLVALWRRTDGLELGPIHARILGPAEVVQLLAEGDEQWNLTARGLLPILHDGESNYLAACVHAPLAPRVLYVPHDDSTRLLYRDFDALVRSVALLLDMGVNATSFYYDAEGDYAPDGPRSAADRAAARALLATDGEDGQWNHAIPLLDAAGDADAFARLLETDHFVRRDVVARMKQMSSPAIEGLLRSDREAFEAFAGAVARAARDAGLPVGRRQDDSVQVGGKWWNLESFFHRRNVRDAMSRLLAWIRDGLEGRNPHDRRGHFMED